jgi:hypothetical protein
MARDDIACLSVGLLPPWFFCANFEIENVAKKFPKHEANLVEFTLEKQKNIQMFPNYFFFIFFGMKKVTKICQEKLLGSAGEVLCTSFELLDYGRGAGGFFSVVGLAFSSQSMSHSLIHSLLTRRKAPLSPPSLIVGK